jgi:hypothetical protein
MEWWDGTKVPLKILDLHPNTLRHRMSKLGISALLPPPVVIPSTTPHPRLPNVVGLLSSAADQPHKNQTALDFAPDVFKSSANPRNLLTELSHRFVRRIGMSA